MYTPAGLSALQARGLNQPASPVREGQTSLPGGGAIPAIPVSGRVSSRTSNATQNMNLGRGALVGVLESGPPPDVSLYGAAAHAPKARLNSRRPPGSGPGSSPESPAAAADPGPGPSVSAAIASAASGAPLSPRGAPGSRSSRDQLAKAGSRSSRNGPVPGHYSAQIEAPDSARYTSGAGAAGNIVSLFPYESAT